MPQEILPRVAAGDASALDECMAAYRGLVWSLARRGTSNLADVEDAVQEIFIEIWRNAGRFDRALSSESTFVTMIARRRLIDRYRRRQRSKETTSLSADPSLEVAAEPESDLAERDEEATRARRQMRHLRREERQILELSIDRGMSQSEIASALNLPLGTVKTHARRGILRLRELLQSSSDDDRPGSSS